MNDIKNFINLLDMEKETFRAIHTSRLKYSVYDSLHLLVYLSEEVLTGYIPDVYDGDTPPAITGYAYTGDQRDGGTLVPATSIDRDTLINALIRTKYSQTEEDAVKTHQIILLLDATCENASEYTSEWVSFCTHRNYCITEADRLLM